MNNEIAVQLTGVTVDIPVYSTNSRSLKSNLLCRGTGARIARDSENHVSVRALEDVNLAFGSGDRVGLIGANGSGKTTLLRVLAGAYHPTQGRVQRRGQVSSLFDWSLGIDSGATGHENIMLRGILLGLTPKEVRERADEIAEFTELGDYLAMPVYTYSAGMRLRLALAVCTSIQPEILLMDEWFGAGDAAFIDKARRRLDKFVSSAGIMVLASHNSVLLESTCALGVLLDSGRVRAFGPIGEVLREYGQVDR